MTPTRANDLRQGDIFLWDNYPADVIETIRLPDGKVKIICGWTDADRLYAPPNSVFNVIGHFDG